MKKEITERNWFAGAHKVTLYEREQGGEGDGKPYLHRWHLLHTPWFRIYLHHIVASDPTLCPHDHPWAFTSVILRGGYIEQIYTNDLPKGPFGYLDTVGGRYRTTTWHPPLSVLRRPAKTAHRLELPRFSTGCWTLVFIGRKTRSWGFWSAGKFIPWRIFVKQEKNGFRCE